MQLSYSSCLATAITDAMFTFKSHLTHLPTMYTSSLPYLPHICQDFWLLEKKSMFTLQLFIWNCTWRLQVISVGVVWKHKAHVFSCLSANLSIRQIIFTKMSHMSHRQRLMQNISAWIVAAFYLNSSSIRHSRITEMLVHIFIIGKMMIDWP